MKKPSDERKLQSYLERIPEIVKNHEEPPLDDQGLQKELNVSPKTKALYQKAITLLLQQGDITVKANHFYPKKMAQIAKGIIRVHARGFGFLVAEDRNAFPEDIFVPKHQMRGAVDGDLVEVRVQDPPYSEKGPEGFVASILVRGRSHLAGTITHLSGKDEAFAYVPILGTEQSMRVTKVSEHSLQPGDRVILQVTKWGKQGESSVGEVAAIIGPISDASCDTQAAIEEYGLDSQFPVEVIEQVKAFPSKVAYRKSQERRDLRSIECFTIDPDTAQDFDDALSLTKSAEGHFHLGVHIADVSHYVAVGTPLDIEAQKRSNSTYLPGLVVPMLPHALSNHLCSLKPNVNRLTVSVLIEFDSKGTLLSYEITRSCIKSQRRFTYREAMQVLEGTLASPHAATLQNMRELCYLLKKQRSARGSIEFSLPEAKVHVDDQGVPQGIEIIHYDLSHQLVEEFMLKANELVATHMSQQNKSFPYRIHEKPQPENLRDFGHLASTFGFHLSEDPTAPELQSLFDEVRDQPYAAFLTTAFIRSQKLASYSCQNAGHWGLGLEFYTHFTSPIRRYIDLIVHRSLFNEIPRGQSLDQVALLCSEKERLSARAENSVILLKKLRLLKQIKQSQKRKTFEAIITAVKPFGLVFEVKELFLEGFIHISEIGNDYYRFNGASQTLVGDHTEECYKSGENIGVLLKKVDLIKRETAWEIARASKGRSHAKD